MMLTRKTFIRNGIRGLSGIVFATNSLGAFDEDYVTLYDTYAIALYMDGSIGPKTGIIRVDYILDNEPVSLPFWHGHNGLLHEFHLDRNHFRELILEKTIFLSTSSVAEHQHKLFIDPINPKWRVPGAKPVQVPRIF